MLRRITKASADGRLLLINTTELDIGQPRVFDLVAEAQRVVDSGQIERVHNIMLASAGIPGYVESYLYAEQATLRKRAVETREVANAIAFLLSPRSSGINAQNLVIDAGMSINYFDEKLIHRKESE